MLSLLLLPLLLVCPQDPPAELRTRLDTFLDARFAPASQPTAAMVKALREAKVDAAGLEAMLRLGRASYPDAPEPRDKVRLVKPLVCDHVDHETALLLFVPKSYDKDKPAPLLVVGHGGSSGRDLAFGQRAALGGLVPWLPTAAKEGAVVIAPLTDRGWGSIGNSILLSAISRAVREFHIDPDRIYLTGHSMGGHLTWRSAITFADHFAAVSPMSGGYDFVKDQQVQSCSMVPGYATWGSSEPYQINEFNRIIAAYMQDHGYAWQNVEKDGGHEIYPDEIPKVWAFFTAHPRDLYRKVVFARKSGRMQFDKAETNPQWKVQNTWQEGRPIPCSTVHWLRLWPLPDETPKDKAVQEVRGEVGSDNTLTLLAQNSRKLTVYLHPRMVDFGKKVRIVVNGKQVFDRKVEPDLAVMLDLVREFDDRGRVFWAKVDVDVPGSVDVPEPDFR